MAYLWIFIQFLEGVGHETTSFRSDLGNITNLLSASRSINFILFLTLQRCTGLCMQWNLVFTTVRKPMTLACLMVCLTQWGKATMGIPRTRIQKTTGAFCTPWQRFALFECSLLCKCFCSNWCTCLKSTITTVTLLQWLKQVGRGSASLLQFEPPPLL